MNQTPTINETEFVNELKQRAERLGSQKRLADELGIPLPYLNQIIKGRRGVSEDIARRMGYARVMLFVKQA